MARTMRHWLAVLASGLLITFALTWWGWESSVHHFHETFLFDASLQSEVVRQHLERQLDDLDALKRFVEVNHEVTREGFRQFVQPMLERQGIQAIEWVPVVPAEQRDSMEARARASGLAAFRISERDPAGLLVPASERAFYYPVYYVEPLLGNEPAIGFDLGSDAKRKAALDAALEQGRPQATAPVSLVQETGGRFSFLVFVPIYRAGAVDSFALGIFRAEDILVNAVKGASNSFLDLALEDFSDAEGVQTLYAAPAIEEPARQISELPFALFFPELSADYPIEFAGRHWNIHASATPAYRANLASLTFLTIPPAGFLISLFAALYLKRVETQAEQLAENVANRTQELDAHRKRLDELNRRYELAATAGSIGIWDWYVQENRLVWDDRMCELYQRDPAELIGTYEDWRGRIHPEDLAHVEDAVAWALSGQKGFSVEFRVVWPDGSVHFLLGTGQLERSDEGLPVRITGVNYDITARKLGEQALKRGRATLRLILDSAAEAIYGIDLKGNCTFCNESCISMLGYASEAELLGKNMHWLIHHTKADGAHFEMCDCNIFRAFQEGEGTHVDDELLWRRDGSSFAAEYWSYPQRVDGKVVGAVVTFIDISERKQAEQTLISAMQAAEAANEAKRAFLANMSHEIRTPLNGIIGMTDLALGLDLTDEVREMMDIIKNSGSSLRSIIEDILDFSKIEAGKLEMEHIALSVSAVVDQALATVTPTARAKGLELSAAVDPGVPPQLMGDPGRLRQVLLNLIGNAMKFTQSGGVSVRVQVLRELKDCVELQFEVEDTGIGIPAEKQAEIFEPFAQENASTTREYGGTGLGLSISRHLVKAMGGRLWLDSTAGQGSTFHFTMVAGIVSASGAAALDLPAQEMPENASDASASPRQLNVLLVEDDLTNQRVATGLLTRWGHQVTVANNGAEAVDRWAAEQFDLIMMDMRMPVMDGLEATRQIRAKEQALGAARTPILALTANAMNSDQAMCLEAGMDAFASKPLRASALKSQLEQF